MQDNPEMSHILFVIIIVNEDIINRDGNNQVQILIEHLV